METLLRTLADDNRRTVLEELRVRPATVNELAAVLPIARPGVSRHLRVLREAGLVEVRRDAQRRIYSCDRSHSPSSMPGSAPTEPCGMSG